MSMIITIRKDIAVHLRSMMCCCCSLPSSTACGTIAANGVEIKLLFQLDCRSGVLDSTHLDVEIVTEIFDGCDERGFIRAVGQADGA